MQRQNFFRRPFGIVAAQRRVVISGARQNLPLRRFDVGQTGNIVRTAGRGLHNGLFRQAQRNRHRGRIVFFIVKLLPAQYRILIAFDDTQRPAVGIYIAQSEPLSQNSNGQGKTAQQGKQPNGGGGQLHSQPLRGRLKNDGSNRNIPFQPSNGSMEAVSPHAADNASDKTAKNSRPSRVASHCPPCSAK